MRMVIKTKKYQVPAEKVEAEALVAQTEQATTQTSVANTPYSFPADVELLLAMNEAKQVKYDICTIAAMQHYIDNNKS